MNKYPKHKKNPISSYLLYLTLFSLIGLSIVVILGLMARSPITRLTADFLSYAMALFFVLVFSYGITVILGRSKKEKKLLIYLILLAVFIRILGASLVIYFEMGKEGYLMGNALRYDRMAWFNTFSNTRLSDISYGFPSIVIFYTLCYKTFSPDAHRPLIPLIILAMTSGLITAFVFIFAKEFWGETVGKYAGIIAAITPEFAFHSWTHLREPILSVGLSMTLFSLALIHQKKFYKGLLTGLIGNVIVLSFHPGFGIGTFVIFLSCFVFMKKEKLKRSLMLFVIIVLLILISTSFAAKGLWKQFTAKSVFTGSYVSEKIFRVSKGEKEKEFDALSRAIFMKLPSAVSVPAQVVYSTTLPYLPIGFYWSTWDFKILMTFRAVSWQIVLPFLLLGFLYGYYEKRRDKILFILGLAAISIISISSVMNMGELWDSTRYRSFGYPIFTCLIAYSMVKSRKRPKNMLLIILLSQLANVGLVFMYKLRGYGDLSTTILEAIGLSVFFLVWHKVLQLVRKNCSLPMQIHFQDSSLMLWLLFGTGILISTLFFFQAITGIGGLQFNLIAFALLIFLILMLFSKAQRTNTINL